MSVFSKYMHVSLFPRNQVFHCCRVYVIGCVDLHDTIKTILETKASDGIET